MGVVINKMADEEKVQEGENANMNMIGKDDIINEV